ncbi:geranylgeranyl transferase type-2 subunit alpha isoform X3 [Folsomia candida]|uniref:geranylgeranyl transferase type-2 subunit alpha isoform X3 n=1 Tax=Folsomia candida TaxID=158441 RepID=UPI000B90A2DF|nr:geranylgeranyl transferase type-2 subunit alpha isoform X3 [Folsomia candida]
MHGRQRVELSPEEEAKKQKEREAKVAAYQFAMKKIIEKRSKGELDSQMLSITGQVLAANPDISTLWNIRKDTLEKLKKAEYDLICILYILNPIPNSVNSQEALYFSLSDFMDTVVPKELEFSAFCLKSNPKSYGAWYHRCWLMKETEFARVEEELNHCSKFLTYDDRNFHGWDYRRFLLDNCSLVTFEEELQFSTDKISSNFSNFSSWHLRSKILPHLSKDYLEEELELIRNAAFTDPKDQSSWLYHLWLLKSQLKKDAPQLRVLQVSKVHVIACFNVPVPMPSMDDIRIEIPGIIWKSPLNSGRSKLWIANTPADAIKDSDVQVSPKTPAFDKLLREELAWVEELHELEPEIKWPIYTAMTLLRMINFVEFKPQITEYLDKLQKIDPKRTNYYNDLRSKFVIEWILLDKAKVDEEIVDLSGLELTSIYYPERFCYHRVIDCSRNKLKNAASLASFVNCHMLDISNNQIPVNLTLVKVLQGLLPNLKCIKSSGNQGFGVSMFSKEFADSVKIV